jgi:hypothetical protein
VKQGVDLEADALEVVRPASSGAGPAASGVAAR